ncbi:MAG: potassium-transporting ATPase subunit C [Nitrososphaeraceae archaeon]|nr:potassium-transporting ATPase subunit C [Nitrososphaeraceae archaeon]
MKVEDNDDNMLRIARGRTMKILEKIQSQFTPNNISPSIKVIILMLIVTGIAYPLILVAIGQNIFPFQSNGSIVTFNGKAIGSKLIAQEFNSPKFFHSRPASDSASGLDPHITPTRAFSQISNISKASGIPENTLRTLVELNIERNKNSNLLAFAPDHVNVLELNMELVRQYNQVYSDVVQTSNNNTLHSGR